jgi:hypothetical protein
MRSTIKPMRDGRGTYSSPSILDDLREAGERVSRKRVARLMKERTGYRKEILSFGYSALWRHSVLRAWVSQRHPITLRTGWPPLRFSVGLSDNYSAASDNASRITKTR